MFELHHQLANDTLNLGTIGVCRVLLMKDANYPWLILVPEVQDIKEIHQLSQEQQLEIMKTIGSISEKMEAEFNADKINVGALGNMVPQLHIHVIARYKVDAAWPKPVWGQVEAKPYTESELDLVANKFKAMLGL